MRKVWEAEDSLDLKISALLRPILPNFDACTVQVKFWDGGNPMDGDEPLENWNRKGTGEISVTILRPDKLDDDGPDPTGEGGFFSPGFKPVPIQGEPLSETIVRERRWTD